MSWYAPPEPKYLYHKHLDGETPFTAPHPETLARMREYTGWEPNVDNHRKDTHLYWIIGGLMVALIALAVYVNSMP